VVSIIAIPLSRTTTWSRRSGGAQGPELTHVMEKLDPSLESPEGAAFVAALLFTMVISMFPVNDPIGPVGRPIVVSQVWDTLVYF